MNNHRESIQAIVFDFGGVLIDWNPRHLYRKLFTNNPQEMERFLEEIGFFAWNLQQDAGRSFAEGVEEHCRLFPEYCELIRAYDDRWEESLGGTIQPSIAILQALKQAGLELYGLSNWSMEKFLLVRSRYEFLSWFESIVISGQVKLVKPDPRIFRLTLEEIGRPASECLLIDDSVANITVARGLGFKTIHFQSPQQLEIELKELGLLPART
jgi:2-haloacid dehalogenase